MQFEIRRSRYAVVFIIGLHVFALIAVFYSKIPFMLQLVMGVFVMVSCLWNLLVQQTSNQLLIQEDDCCYLIQASGREILAQLAGSSTVTRWVAILRFRIPGQRRLHSEVIWRDAMPADDYRRLRVKLLTFRNFV